MKRLQIILIILAIALVGTLYSLPKVVVENGQSEESAFVDETIAGSNLENHSEAISEEDLPKIERWKSQLFVNGEVQNDEQALEGLMLVFKTINKFDSAAYYAGLFADNYQEIKHWRTAGDAYFEAFTFALDRAKIVQMAGKAREYYDKVLDAGENDLDIRSNVAMTYVEGSNPMQGILMLRGILQEDPQHERALFYMGSQAMRSRQYEIAIERFEALVEHHPANIQGQYWLAACYFQADQKDKAKEQLEKVKQMEIDEQLMTAVDELLERIK